MKFVKFSVRTKDGSFRETIEAATFDEAARKALRKIHHKRLSVLRTTGESKMDGWFQGYQNVSPGCNSSYGSAVWVEEYVPGTRTSGATKTEKERRSKGQIRFTMRLGPDDTATLGRVREPGETDPAVLRRGLRMLGEIASKSSSHKKSTGEPK